jgi:NAD(P)H dehydrogenase (quinone)
MKVLIIYCHPSQRSYTHQILKQLKAGLSAAELSYKVSDLYAMNFQSDMTETEYEREGFANLERPIPPDVAEEHRKIEAADCIIFLYPLWWSDCPAKLKGWFDRVYSVGYAYGYDGAGRKIQKMKTVPRGIVICTAGHPNEFLREIGIAESIRNVMLDDRLGKRFQQREMIILGGTLDLEKVKEQHRNIIKNLIEKLQEL